MADSVVVVVVSYNSARYLPVCLDSLRGVGVEIIVVDNASTDDSAAVARRHGVRVIANSENRGLAAAANQGARASAAEFLLFLNPDTVLLDGFADLLRAVVQEPQAGAVAGLLLDEAGRPQVGFNVRRLPSFVTLACEVLLVNRLWPRNPVNRRYRCLDLPLDRPGEIEQPAGACLLVRRRALEQVGYWDERFYPLWFEDVDLCVRLRRSGYRILFCPTCRWRHHGGHSLDCISFARRQLFWYRNLLYYVHKHMGSAAALAMRLLVCAGAAARWMATLAVPSGQHRSSAYWAVMKLALSRPAKQPPPRVV